MRALDFVLFGLLTLTCVGVAKANSRCYSCSGITNPHNCDKIIQCDSSQQCFTRSYISDSLSVLFDLGCLDNGFCAILPPKLRIKQFDEFSRPDHYEADMTSDREPTRQKRQKEAPLCTQCCNNDEHCNSDLCPNSLISRPPGRKCYDCGKVLLDDPAECTTIRVCAPGQECHVTEVINPVGTKFQVNCMSKQLCQAIGNNTSFGKRDRYLCRTCCDADYCNIDYCSHIRDLPTVATVPTTTPATTTTTMPTTTTQQIVALQSLEAPQNETLVAGGRLEYTCEVTGLPVPSLTWVFKDKNGQTQTITNKAVTSGTKSILTLNPVSMADEGTYTCVADNGLQTLELPGTLTVHGALQSKERPRNTTLLAGGTVVFSCEVTGLPSPTLTWRFESNTGQSQDVTKKAVTSGNKSTLILDRVLITEEGTYTCIADNGLETLELPGTLSVYTKLFLSSSPASNISPTEGDAVTMQCSYDGYPRPTITWFRVDATTGNRVAAANLKTENDGRTAILDSINRNDSGRYVCQGDNSFDKKTQQVDIDVQFAPEFQTPAVQSLTVKENESITLDCHAVGNPKPVYSFFFLDGFDNPAVIPGVILDNGAGTMKIPQAPKNIDGGSITCSAVNPVASVRRTTNIKVIT